MSYTDLKNQYLDDIGFSGSTDTTISNYFDRTLGAVYQTTLAFLDTWVSQVSKTAQTAVNQQYYHNPAGISKIESITITIGSINYPLTPIDSELSWERINQTLITTTAIPQFFFPRRDDFGVWPIPQGIYTMTLNHLVRDRNLTVADYSTGNINLTNNSQTATGTGGATFSSAMIGRWLTSTIDGFWYRISNVPTSTTLTLETSFEGATVTGDTYRVCQTPEMPEEGHMLLAYGTTARYFAGPFKNIQTAEWFNNMYWTGDGNNESREERGVLGGLIGLKMRYSERSDSKIIQRKPSKTSQNTKLWASSIH